MVQAQSLRGYRELVGDLGGNPTRLLRQAGIDPGDLNRLTTFIGFDAQIDLLERTAAERRCPDFAPGLTELIGNPLCSEVWADSVLSPPGRSIATVASLIALYCPEEWTFHLPLARDNEVTREQLSALITHVAF